MREITAAHANWRPIPRRIGIALALAAATAISWRAADVRLGELFSLEAASALSHFLAGLLPADLSPGFLEVVFRAVGQTVATAVAATILSIVCGLPLGILASATLWRSGILVEQAHRGPGFFALSALSYATRALLGFIRAVPDILWAILFVTMVGLGSLAGTLALAVAYSGLIGRVYADAFDATAQQPLEALQSTGASRLQIFVRGVWPQALPALTTYTLYSFECAVRAASVLGLVGAGGIGYEIGISMRLFDYGQVFTLILALVALLALTDVASQRLRRRLNRGGGAFDARRPDAGPDTVRSRRGRTLLMLALAVGAWASFYYAGFTPEVLEETNVLAHAARFGARMFPPDVSAAFVSRLGGLLLQTFAIAFLGTLIGAAAGAALALPATANLILVTRDDVARRGAAERLLRWLGFWGTRLVLNFMRAIPELVWVLVCILAIGIGPFAGTLAIGLHTAGVLGKLYAESMEEVARPPLDALEALGARPSQVLLRGIWPQARPMLRNYTLLRWEANLRVSTILGLVGGGGLGQAIYNSIQLGFEDRVATMLLLVYASVVASDWFGDQLRAANA